MSTYLCIHASVHLSYMLLCYFFLFSNFLIFFCSFWYVLSICLPLYPSVHPSSESCIHPSIHPSILLTYYFAIFFFVFHFLIFFNFCFSFVYIISMSTYLFMHASIHPLTHSSITLSFYLSLHPSFYPSYMFLFAVSIYFLFLLGHMEDVKLLVTPVVGCLSPVGSDKVYYLLMFRRHYSGVALLFRYTRTPLILTEYWRIPATCRARSLAAHEFKRLG